MLFRIPLFFALAVTLCCGHAEAACNTSSLTVQDATGTILKPSSGLYHLDRPLIVIAQKTGNPQRILLSNKIIHNEPISNTCKLTIFSFPLDSAQKTFAVAIPSLSGGRRLIGLPSIPLGIFTLSKPDVFLQDDMVTMSGFAQIGDKSHLESSQYISLQITNVSPVTLPPVSFQGSVALRISKIRCGSLWDENSCSFDAAINSQKPQISITSAKNDGRWTLSSTSLSWPEWISNSSYSQDHKKIALSINGQPLDLILTDLRYSNENGSSGGTFIGHASLISSSSTVSQSSPSLRIISAQGSMLFDLATMSIRLIFDDGIVSIGYEKEPELKLNGDENYSKFFGVKAEVKKLSMIFDQTGVQLEKTAQTQIMPLEGSLIFGRELTTCKKAQGDTTTTTNSSEEDHVLCIGMHLMPGVASSDDDIANVFISFGSTDNITVTEDKKPLFDSLTALVKPSPLPTSYSLQKQGSSFRISSPSSKDVPLPEEALSEATQLASYKPLSLTIKLPEKNPVSLRVGGSTFNISKLDFKTSADANMASSGGNDDLAGDITNMSTELPGYDCRPYVRGSITVSSVAFGGRDTPLSTQPMFEFGDNCFRMEITGYLLVPLGEHSSVGLTRVVVAHQRMARERWYLPTKKSDRNDAHYRGVACMPLPTPSPTSTQKPASTSVPTTSLSPTPLPTNTQNPAFMPHLKVGSQAIDGTESMEYDRVEAAGTITSGNVSAVFRRVGFQREDRCPQRFYTFYDLDPGMTFALNAVQNSDQIGRILTALGGALAGLLLKH